MTWCRAVEKLSSDAHWHFPLLPTYKSLISAEVRGSHARKLFTTTSYLVWLHKLLQDIPKPRGGEQQDVSKEEAPGMVEMYGASGTVTDEC